jgi:deoxyribose-phosphate aldolase
MPNSPRNVASVAALIDHAILQPTATPAAMREELAGLRGSGIKSVCIKPHAVSLAVDALSGSGVLVGTVVGFPHGGHHVDVKAYEASKAFDDGASEIDMVINIGIVRGEDWAGVREEIAAVQNVAGERGGLLKVIFETDYLPEEALKIRLCQVCSEVGVAFVKTSTGYGYVRYDDGSLGTKGAQLGDIRLMRTHSSPYVGVKASGGIRTLDALLAAVEAGANRIGTTSTGAILREARGRFHG